MVEGPACSTVSRDLATPRSLMPKVVHPIRAAVKSVPVKTASLRLATPKRALLASAPLKSTWRRSAPIRLASRRSASRRSARRRSASAKVHLPKISPAQIQFAQARSAQVWFHGGITTPPHVPNVYAFSKNCEVFRVGHTFSPPPAPSLAHGPALSAVRCEDARRGITPSDSAPRPLGCWFARGARLSVFNRRTVPTFCVWAHRASGRR